jgi:hypothetical protein
MTDPPTYFEEQAELRVVVDLILESFFRHGKMTNVNGVRQPELCCCLQENITDSLNNGRLFTLSHVHGLQKTSIAFSEVENVTEDIFNEVI